MWCWVIFSKRIIKGDNMKNYEKPMVLMNEELAEGVYAGSGDCYTFTIEPKQAPELGRNNYKFQINGRHDAADEHHSTMRYVTIEFNQPVTYVSSLAASQDGSGTSVLTLHYYRENGSYHNNAHENIGLGDLVVTSEEGLAVMKIYCSYCDHSCEQHN